MAGETSKTRAVCLEIRPWSRTSHIVSWLTPLGLVTTVVKGAVRPKSAFLGQYDLNYTCEIVYYLRARGELHALREATPLDDRSFLRTDYRRLALADYFRSLAALTVPPGRDAFAWFELLEETLDGLEPTIPSLLRFELALLRLMGLKPDFTGYDAKADWSAFSIESGRFDPAGGRLVRVSAAVADYLRRGAPDEKKLQISLDAARVIGVFYQFHLDCAADVRRTVIGMILKTDEGKDIT